MSSQKYGVLKKRTEVDEEGTERVEQFWYCKLQGKDCEVLSYSNDKPMCDHCAVAKDFKNFKKGRGGMFDKVKEMKLSDILKVKGGKR